MSLDKAELASLRESLILHLLEVAEKIRALGALDDLVQVPMPQGRRKRRKRVTEEALLALARTQDSWPSATALLNAAGISINGGAHARIARLIKAKKLRRSTDGQVRATKS